MKVKNWIIDRERTGRLCFSRDDVAEAFPSLSASSIDSSLSRFRSNGLIQAVHRGFYCVIPAHYAYVGNVPPSYYIDSLMKWLGRPYYIALLSAAEMFGAAHQKPMVTQVMTELPCFSYSKKKNDSVDWQFRAIPTAQGDSRPSPPSLQSFERLPILAGLGREFSRSPISQMCNGSDTSTTPYLAMVRSQKQSMTSCFRCEEI